MADGDSEVVASPGRGTGARWEHRPDVAGSFELLSEGSNADSYESPCVNKVSKFTV